MIKFDLKGTVVIETVESFFTKRSDQIINSNRDRV